MSIGPPDPYPGQTWVAIEALVKGDKFVTLGGQTLTVVRVEPADRADYDYRQVVTEEPYDGADLFVANRRYKVRVVN